MKEVRYKGDLDYDYKALHNESVLKNSTKLKPVRILFVIAFAYLVIWFLLYGLVSPAVNFVILLGAGLTEVLAYKSCVKKAKEDLQDKMNGLVEQLDHYDVHTDSIGLSRQYEYEGTEKVTINKKIPSGALKSDVFSCNELTRYWSFLDKDEQVQVLKYIKRMITNNKNQDEVFEKYFLLEDEDKNVLDEPIKKTLRLNK